MSVETEIFARLSGGRVETPFRIVVYDAAGKVATGYIGAVGVGETLGSELVTNGGFDPDSGWNKVENWTIVDGKGVATAAAPTAQLYQTLSATNNWLLKAQSTISEYVSGMVQFYFNTGIVIQYSEEIRADGTYTKYGVCDNTFGNYCSHIVGEANTTLKVDNFTIKRITDPPATAVHIVSALNGTTRAWESIESGFNPNTIASWKVYDLAHPGFYLTGVGTFNRGDFTATNAFFWSSVDLSPYKGTLITESTSLTALVGNKIYPLTVPEDIEFPT